MFYRLYDNEWRKKETKSTRERRRRKSYRVRGVRRVEGTHTAQLHLHTYKLHLYATAENFLQILLLFSIFVTNELITRSPIATGRK